MDILAAKTTLRIRPENFKCQKCGSFFISTAFLCCGTATDPEKEYNIEFLSPRHSLSQQLEGILASMSSIPTAPCARGPTRSISNPADHIEDLLTFMGAGGAAMRIMEQRMYNDMRNKTNRLSNCETANIGKSVQAAVQVQLAIETLQAAGALEHPARDHCGRPPGCGCSTQNCRLPNWRKSLTRLSARPGFPHQFKTIQEAPPVPGHLARSYRNKPRKAAA